MSALEGNLFAEAQPIAAFKKQIKAKDLELKQLFDPNHSVSKLIKAKSDFIDCLLTQCWKHFLGKAHKQHSLIAVGGYGRREIFPHSDIDIFILIDERYLATIEDKLGEFSTFLWDIGLNPGQSVRNIDECINEAKKDQTIFTALLETRFITGNKSQYQVLKHRIHSDAIWSPNDFFAAKMQEQQQRYAKYHDTAYKLEPNVKESPGGLRDVQVIGWVFKHHYHSATLRELIKYDFLPASEYAELSKVRNILWQVRYALHLLTNRHEDRLLFEYQRELAEWFGFDNREDNQSVERFMQYYYKNVVKLERLNEMLLQLFRERFINPENPAKMTELNARFRAVNGYIEVKHDAVFQQNPLALLEIFLLFQHRPKLKGVRATTIRLIRKSIKLINDDFRQNKTAKQLFLDIFSQPCGITHQLRRMNRYGILAAYLPSFAHIVARMQYDLFHIYTVDEHTMMLIRNLRRFSLEKHSDELPFCNQVFLLIPKPEILYLAGLFHDIAKGKGGDHSVLGEVIAADFCKQHHLSKHDSDLITWIVRHHLVMSMTAQRKDISDPDIIHEFASIVGTAEYLNHLYLFTVADIRATNPELWNSWKNSLLRELYTTTHNALKQGLQSPSCLTDRIKTNKDSSQQELLKLGLSLQQINDAWQQTSNDYFLRYSADEIAWHSVAIANVNESELPLVLLRPQSQRGSAEIFIYSKEIDNVFSLCTATLDQLGLSIVDARIITTDNQYIFNSFQVLEQSGESLNELFREIRICNTVRHNLLEQELSSTENINRKQQQAKHFPIASEVNFKIPNEQQHSQLEIISTDKAGLLSQLGKIFQEHHLNLHSAKITTIGSRVEDIFYISNQDLPIALNENQQQQLKTALLAILT